MPIRQFSHEEIFKGLVYRIAESDPDHTLNIRALNQAFVEGARRFDGAMKDFSYLGDYSFALAKMLVEFNSSVVRRTRTGYKITPPLEGQFEPKEDTTKAIDLMFDIYQSGIKEPARE